MGIEGIAGQEIERLALYIASARALNTPDLELQVHAPVATGQIPNLPRTPVVPSAVNATAAATDRFFERRTSVMMQAFGSPKTPRTVGCGRKPGNAYASHSRRCRFDKFAMRKSSQFRAIEKTSLIRSKNV
ncbi:MAG: hypothetical protein ABIP64_10535 [Burkholderiales bacterium]